MFGGTLALRMARLLLRICGHIGYLDDPFAAEQACGGARRYRGQSADAKAPQTSRCAAYGNSAEVLPIVELQGAESDSAKAVRLFQHRVEHRCEVAG